MSNTSNLRERQIDEAVAEYLEAERLGRPIGALAWLAKHAEVRDELENFLANRSVFTRAAGPVEPPTMGLDESTNGTALPTVRYFGDYELIEEIARGGMGVVYKARQVSLNRVVALKMIIAGKLASADDVHRFRTEAEAAANLDHPNILPIYEVGEHEGQQYFSMKYIDGGTFSSWLKKNGTAENAENTEKKKLRTVFSASSAVKLLSSVAEAVHFAHQRGILHRDLKPGNILLDSDKTPYVADFGLAKRTEGDVGVTQSGALVGTPSYMAPEQARADKQLTTAVDVYALGAMLYEALTGRPPFQAPSVIDTVMQVLEREPDHPSKVNPAADRDLATIALKCLEKDPTKRYGSAEALADELERWQRGETIEARPVGVMERAWKWAKRQPLVAELLACAVVAVIGAFVAVLSMLWFANKAANETERRATVESARASEAEAAGEKQRELTKETIAAQKQSERAAYFNSVVLAQQYWRNDYVSGACRLLEACPKEHRHWEWRFLDRLCHGELLTLPGNGQFTMNLVFSKDGQRLGAMAGSGKSGMAIWDRNGNGWVRRTEIVGTDENRRYLNWSTVSPDGKYVAAADLNKKEVILYDAETGRELRVLCTLPKIIWKLDFSPDGRQIAVVFGQLDEDESLAIFNVADGSDVLRKPDVRDVRFLPDGKRLIVVNRPLAFFPDNQVIRVLDATTGKFTANLGPGVYVALSPDGRFGAIGHVGELGSTSVRLVEIETGKTVFAPPGVSDANHMAISPDNTRFAMISGSEDKVLVWDIARRTARTIRGHSDAIVDLQFTPDGLQLVTCGMDNTIRFWDPETDIEAHRTPAPTRNITFPAVKLARNGQRAAFATHEMSLLGAAIAVTVQDATSGKEIRHFGRLIGTRVLTPGLSTDGTRIITQGRAKPIQVWDVDSGSEVCSYSGHDGSVTHIELSPNGQWAASASQTREYTDRPKSVAPRSEAMKEVLHVWDATTGRFLWQSTAHASRINQLAISPDNRRVATYSHQTIRVWDATTGTETLTINDEKVSGSFGITFSSKCDVLAANAGRQVVLWDLASSKPRLELRGPRGSYIEALAFSFDDQRLATAHEREVKLWDTTTGQEVLSLPLLPDADNKDRKGPAKIKALAFSADGHRLIAALSDGTSQYWDATPR